MTTDYAAQSARQRANRAEFFKLIRAAAARSDFTITETRGEVEGSDGWYASAFVLRNGRPFVLACYADTGKIGASARLDSSVYAGHGERGPSALVSLSRGDAGLRDLYRRVLDHPDASRALELNAQRLNETRQYVQAGQRTADELAHHFGSPAPEAYNGRATVYLPDTRMPAVDVCGAFCSLFLHGLTPAEVIAIAEALKSVSANVSGG